MRFLFLVLLLLSVGIAGWQMVRISNRNKPQYQTAKAERGTLIVSISVSGQVSAATSAEATTQASGVVKAVFVKDGDLVRMGDKIAEIDLDLTGRQRSQQAYASYQNAQNAYESAKANLYGNHSTMLTNWKTYMDKAQNSTYKNADDTPNAANRQLVDFMTTQDDWLSSEAKYKAQEKAILQMQTALNAAWYSYQQSSPTIVAPISGIVTGLSLQIGSVITAQTNSSGGSSSQKIASVKTEAPLTAIINLTQIDAPKVKPGQKATLTFDAFPDKTFTGEVISLDTIGTVSSGVTTYPAIIRLDSTIVGLLPNMTASAAIITATKDNALLVPSSTIQNQNGQSVVRVMINGKPRETNVQTGLTSDSHTEILSGVNEGDVVVTGQTNGTSSNRTNTNQSSSPFSPFGRIGGGGGMIRH